MKIILSTLVSLAVVANAESVNNNMQTVVKEGVGYIKQVGSRMKSEVKKRMKDDPTGLQAAYFCNKSVGTIAKEVSSKFPEGVRVYRTSLKIRNEKNAPDDTDKEVLNSFEKQIKDGTFKKKPKVVEVDGKYRVYVPLVIEKTCLKCHGSVSKMDKKVVDLLKQKYPNDKAVDFKEGDLRGVIVAEMPKK